MRSGKNPNIDDDTRARARQFAVAADAGVEPEVMPMPAVTASPRPRRAPIVTKEELAKKGLSLRDYMNKQQGLTRRKDKTDPTAGEARDRAAQEAADAIDPGKPQTRTGAPVRPEDYSAMKRGGKVKKMSKGGSVSSRADGIASKGKTNCKMR